MIQTLTTICAYVMAIAGFIALLCLVIALLYGIIERVINMSISHLGVYKTLMEFAHDKAKYKQLLEDLKENSND